jgi:hypothetical protein
MEGTGGREEVERKDRVRINSSSEGGFRRSHMWNVKRSCRDLAREEWKAKKNGILKWVIYDNQCSNKRIVFSSNLWVASSLQQNLYVSGYKPLPTAARL